MALIILITVVPSSGRQEWVLDKANNLKCYLKSQPERGLANKELIQFLSKSLKIPQSAIILLAGDTARKKKIKIDCDITYDHIMRLLQLEVRPKQSNIF